MNNLYTSPILLLLIGFLYFITFLSNHNRKIASNAENFSNSSSSGSEASGSKPDPISDNNCTIKSAPNNTFNQIALLSLPGSGNTWTRHLIEQSTGYLTGSIYQDGRLVQTLKGEFLNPSYNQTIAIKTHRLDKFFKKNPKENHEENYHLSACIFIIRDLADSILAEFTRNSIKGHSHAGGEINLELLESDRWHKFIDWMSKDFVDVYGEEAVEFCNGEVFVVRYEELKKGEGSIVRIMEDLTNFVRRINDKGSSSFPITFRKNCLQNNLQGSYHRNHTRKINIRKYFTEEEKRLVNQRILSMNESLVGRHGVSEGLPVEYLL